MEVSTVVSDGGARGKSMETSAAKSAAVEASTSKAATAKTATAKAAAAMAAATTATSATMRQRHGRRGQANGCNSQQRVHFLSQHVHSPSEIDPAPSSDVQVAIVLENFCRRLLNSARPLLRNVSRSAQKICNALRETQVGSERSSVRTPNTWRRTMSPQPKPDTLSDSGHYSAGLRVRALLLVADTQGSKALARPLDREKGRTVQVGLGPIREIDLTTSQLNCQE
jgi:hypothetical protein